MTQDRQGARIGTNCVRQTPHTPNPPWLYPPVGPVIDDTHEALFHLADTLLRHGTVVEGNLGQGAGPSRVGPSHIDDPLRSPDPTRSRYHTRHVEGLESHIMPHPCTTCIKICYGPFS